MPESDQKPPYSLNVPFKRSYWVIPGKLLAGCYPGAIDVEDADKKVTRLVECGIRCIVNLMEEDEVNFDGIPFASYEGRLLLLQERLGEEIEVVRFPIKDMGVVPAATMQEILDELDRTLEAGRPAYVHCWGGRGRTGIVVGCYLARHGIAVGEDALTHIQRLRSGDATAHLASPETREQRALVLSWRRDQ